MKHFVDELLNREYNLAKELASLETLFLRKSYGYSIYDLFSSSFIDWELRSNYIDFDDFFTETGLEEIADKSQSGCDISLEEYVYYCEYMLNVLAVPVVWEHRYSNPILDNITRVLSKINYTPHQSGNVYHIVQNDVLVSEAANIVQTNYDLGEGIYAFNYRETKGNLVRKADILCRLYKYIESITPQAKQYGYTTLLDDIKDLSNKLDIRHAPTAKQGAVIGDMDVSEYEEWLDEIFRLSLTLIILVDYTIKRKDIKELKSKLG